MKLKYLSGLSIIFFISFMLAILLMRRSGLGISSEFLDKKGDNSSLSNVDDLNTDTLTEIPKKFLTLTVDEVAKHSANSDCWIIISNKVYIVTDFIIQHPGGAKEIVGYCGKDATVAFNTMGGRGKVHSFLATQLLAALYLGDLGTAIKDQSQVDQNSNNPVTNSPQDLILGNPSNEYVAVPQIVSSTYSGFSLIEGKYEDDGRWEGKIYTNSGCKAIKVDFMGTIVQDEKC